MAQKINQKIVTGKRWIEGISHRSERLNRAAEYTLHAANDHVPYPLCFIA
jgi:hypothetical protein